MTSSSKKEDNNTKPQIRLDTYSRHPLRGPLYPGQAGSVVNNGASFVPIDPVVSPAYRSARLNHYSPFINVHSSRVDGRLPPPRRPRMPMNNIGAARVDGLRVPPGNRGVAGINNMWGANSQTFSQAASRVLIVNPMHIVNLSEHTKSRLIRIIEALKRFSEKWFSHVLLLLFLAIYACFGAYIFTNFEAPNEHHEKQLIISMRMKIVNDSWNARDRLKPAYFELLRMRFEEYEQLLNKACAMGFSSTSLENQWTFWGALFYSMTVFTTIGYGHLTPVTFAGRIATMIYAIFGIPILLMVLADLGKLLTRVIKYAFNKLRLFFWRLFRRKGAQRTRKIISDNTNQYIGVAKDAFEKGFAYMPYVPQALRSNSIKSSGNNNKQNTPFGGDNDTGPNQTTSVIITSSAPTKAVSPDINGPPSLKNQATGQQQGNNKKRRNSAKLSPSSTIKQKPQKESSDQALSNGNTDATDDQLDDLAPPLGCIDPVTGLPDAPAFEDIDDEFDLPVSIALALLIMYMMFGAVMFSAWEGWNFFDSLYFVFISMSTIGFGDLVPQHPKRMLATFIYLLFGLALTSMCINVVQEKIHATFLKAKMQIGEKMGLDLEQIMADDYYEDDDAYNNDEDDEHDDNNDNNNHGGKNNNDNGHINKAPVLANSEPSSNNSSLTRGRKRSTSIKDDKNKKAPKDQEALDTSRSSSQKSLKTSKDAENVNPDNSNSKSTGSLTNLNTNNKAKLKATQSQPLTNTNNKSNSTVKLPDDAYETDKLKRPIVKKKSTLPILEAPVIKQLDEPMPPPRSHR